MSIERASVSYPATANSGIQQDVLRDFSLDVPDGGFVVLFGPNGCGKSTLLNAIAGIVGLNAGRIAIDGLDPGQAKIAYIFQDYRETILPWKSVIDNITYPLQLRGIGKQDRVRRAKSLLAELRINIPIDAWPKQLSGGQQQLMVIARALIYEPDLMLFDEPFSALDVQTRIQMRSKLQDIWGRKHATTLFVSHEIDEAILLADRVVMLSKRPAHPIDVIEVPFDRPRTQGLLEHEQFFALRRRALKSFREAIEA